MTETRRVLFVCMGNICRSPAAEGVARHMAAERGLDGRVEIESAGTIDYHVGEPPDDRMRAVAATRGYELDCRARQVTAEDLERFDLLIAMDRDNLAHLRELRSELDDATGCRAELRLLSDFLPEGSAIDVPDPYYGGGRGFEDVLDMIERAVPRILDALVAGLAEPSLGASGSAPHGS
jgi:protein-tyrosine phosphatase